MLNWILLIPIVLLAAASIQDLRTREVSDGFSVAIATSAVVCIAFGWWPLSWAGCGLGGLIGIILGVMLFTFGRFGGADAKLTAALGLWFGPLMLPLVMVWVALAGAVLAGIAYARGKKELAYVPAILAGVILHATMPNLWISLTP
ncbi:MAG: prepilin peptidase [Planctomycetota bacterium]